MVSDGGPENGVPQDLFVDVEVLGRKLRVGAIAVSDVADVEEEPRRLGTGRRQHGANALHTIPVQPIALPEPAGKERDAWRFPGNSLTRAHVAMRLQHDLQINLAGVALAMLCVSFAHALPGDLNSSGRVDGHDLVSFAFELIDFAQFQLTSANVPKAGFL